VRESRPLSEPAAVRRRRSGLVTAIALGLAGAACQGADVISIGAAASTDFYISPLGSDQDPGTRTRPWRTFHEAVSRIGPGSTLTLLDGVYDAATTGPVDLRCGVTIANGTATSPIVMRADNQRRAFLRGNGKVPPFFMEGCSYWTIEGLRAESQDLPGAPDTPDAGSVFVLGRDNHDIALRWLGLANPNRAVHSHVLRVGDGSSNITVEDCELYTFHHNGFEVSRATGVVLRRNYVNARVTPDITIPGAYVSPYPDRGDVGFLLEETRFAILENNIVEGVHDGFSIVGRYKDLPANNPVPAANPIEGNRLLGNVVLGPAGSGFLLESRCLNQNPCLDRTRIVAGTELTDNIVIGGHAGVASTGAVDTSISQLTAVNTDFGVNLERTAENLGVTCNSATVNALAVGFRQTGFSSSGENVWKFDHCAAIGTGGQAYVPNDARVTSPVAVDPGLGTCLVYLPRGSPLAQAGAESRPIGGQVVNRYEKGVLTTTPLWNRATGAFPCGDVIADLNGDPRLSCTGVSQRLHIGPADSCPLP
jgi:hypothetical protein